MIENFNPANYGSSFYELINNSRINDLGPGAANQDIYNHLKTLDPQTAFDNQAIKDMDMAKCCISGVWLLHDFLNESHIISQDINTTTGSYWHGIMHRREPDPSNAKYWFRKVNSHTIYNQLSIEAQHIANDHPNASNSDHFKNSEQWDPYKFIDLCEQARGTGSEDENLCKKIQKREWELLFDYCYTMAVK